MPRKPTEAEKEAAGIAKVILWVSRNKGALGLAAGVYALGGGSGTVVSNMFASDKVFQDSVMKRMDKMEAKVDKVLVAARVFGGSFLELKDGPRALKEYRRKAKDRREAADPFGLSMDVEDPQLHMIPESPKPIAQGKPRAERLP